MQVPHTGVARTEGFKGNDIHFGSDETRKLGERYAAEMLKLQGKQRARRPSAAAVMDIPPEEPVDEATAYHEAGHAVMALVLGRPVAFVSALPARQHLGICEFGKAVFRPSEDWLERELLITLAGLAAESCYTGQYDWHAAGKDLASAERLALNRAGGHERKAQRLLRRSLAKAEHLLRQEAHWRAVERLAAELVSLGEVSGRAARHIYAEEIRKQR